MTDDAILDQFSRSIVTESGQPMRILQLNGSQKFLTPFREPIYNHTDQLFTNYTPYNLYCLKSRLMPMIKRYIEDDTFRCISEHIEEYNSKSSAIYLLITNGSGDIYTFSEDVAKIINEVVNHVCSVYPDCCYISDTASLSKVKIEGNHLLIDADEDFDHYGNIVVDRHPYDSEGTSQGLGADSYVLIRLSNDEMYSEIVTDVYKQLR
jgi:hypothetical protein